MVEIKKKVDKVLGKDDIPPDEMASPYPPMQLAQLMHRLTIKDDLTLQGKAFDEIIIELENPFVYRIFKEKIYQGRDPMIASAKLTEHDLEEMEKKNTQKLQELENAVSEAIESAGDMEVMDTRIIVARYSSRTLSAEAALAAYEKVLALSKVSSSKKIDALMACARIASFYSDTGATQTYIERAHKLAESGGGADWDRRNRLKVYRAIQSMLHRDMEMAAGLLLDCIATFSCTEMCTYQQFIVYTILTNMLHLPRPELKKTIIDGPEILSVSKDIPEVIKLVNTFYECDYKSYFHAMVQLEEILLQDRFLYPHTAFWMRELHILAYKQFLDSYQSVTLTAMANAFGVSTDFVDYHASRFIAANRLTAKIDKYGGVIVTARPDVKNAQYREMIQKGDLLLNRIQKLARAVDL